MIIIAILAALLVVGGGVTAVLLVKDRDSATVAEQAPEPADSSVVVQKIEPGVIEYGDLAVLDACAVMPATMIEELGFEAAAHGWRSQAYVPRSTEATVEDQIGDPISSCLYESMAEKQITRFTLTLWQKPFNRLSRVESPAKDETQLPVSGVRAYLSPGSKPDGFDARIISEDSTVQAYLGATTMADDKDVTDYRGTFVTLVERVAANLLKGPQGQATNVHVGRYQGVPNACDVLSAELFEELTGSRDSGLVEADFHEPEGFREFVTDKNEVRHFYSNRQDCRRLSPEWFNVGNRGAGKALKVELQTYRTADMAVKDAQDCNPNSPSRAITGEAVLTDEKIGDYATCSFMTGKSPTMSFVAGRTQVRLTGYGDWVPEDPRKYNEVFTPIARRVVDEVRKAIG